MKKKIGRSLIVRWIITGAALVLFGAAMLAVSLSVDFADWYAFNFYPVLINIFARASGFLPFSLAEAVIVLAGLTVIFAVVYFIGNMIKRRGGRLRFLISSVSTVVMTAALAAMFFTYSCGINYYRSPFSAYSGIKVGKYTKEQLYDTLIFMVGKVNGLVPQLELDGEGNCILPADLYDQADAAMYNIAEQYPALRSYYPHPKPVIASPLMCYTQIVGFFAPYTMEANYNTRERPESIGYTLCHELSHMTGFMREDEANFISYIACRESGSVYLQYSGCHSALKNLMNAYSGEVSGEEYSEIWKMLDPRVSKQIVMYNEFWDQYETPVATVSTAINDTYLKINNQADGTKSYGRMTDLVIAEYLEHIRQ